MLLPRPIIKQYCDLRSLGGQEVVGLVANLLERYTEHFVRAEFVVWWLWGTAGKQIAALETSRAISAVLSWFSFVLTCLGTARGSRRTP